MGAARKRGTRGKTGGDGSFRSSGRRGALKICLWVKSDKNWELHFASPDSQAAHTPMTGYHLLGVLTGTWREPPSCPPTVSWDYFIGAPAFFLTDFPGIVQPVKQMDSLTPKGTSTTSFANNYPHFTAQGKKRTETFETYKHQKLHIPTGFEGRGSQSPL